jgi:hypothetical protein
VPKLLEPLADEADSERLEQIKILTSAPAENQRKLRGRGRSNFKRFKEEMAALGIEAEWRLTMTDRHSTTDFCLSAVRRGPAADQYPFEGRLQ